MRFILAILVLIIPNAARSFCVYNESHHSCDVSVYPGNFKKHLQEGGSACCNWQESSCNPDKERYSVQLVRVSCGAYQSEVKMGGGGYAVIENLGQSGDSHIVTSGYRWKENRYVFLDDSRAIADNNSVVRFLATADPQYDNRTDYEPNRHSWDVAHAMTKQFENDQNIRGIIVAGDLTQNTRPNDEFRTYKNSWKNTVNYDGYLLERDYSPYVFDGLGNHDQEKPSFWQRLACRFKADTCVDPSELKSYMGRGRATALQEVRSPHYSWNWGNVHFVQLNTYPGTAEDKDLFGHDGMDAYKFLVDDLTQNVGHSDRPVVIIHHMPPNHQDMGKNVTQIMSRYFDTIKDYNVIGIISGHTHSRNINTRFYDIPLYVLTTSRNCEYYEFTINGEAIEITPLGCNND